MRIWLPGRSKKDEPPAVFDPNGGVGVLQCPACGCWLKTHTILVRCPDCNKEMECKPAGRSMMDPPDELESE